jgi:hypothetical protein
MGAGSSTCCGLACCGWLDKDEKVMMVKTTLRAPYLPVPLGRMLVIGCALAGPEMPK